MRALSLAAIAASLLIASCGATAKGAPAGGTTVGARLAPDRVALVTGGIARPLLSGEELPLSGPLLATVTLRAVEGVPGARILVLRIHGDGGTPVTDVMVQVAGTMRFMGHGDFSAAATSAGDGTYVAPLQFAMAGTWELTVTVRNPTDRAATIQLELELL